MNNEQLSWQQELTEEFGDDYDPTFVPVWHASWCDYEEHGYMWLLERDGQLYVKEGGYSVMAEDNRPYWDPFPVTDEQAIDFLVDWEEYLE